MNYKNLNLNLEFLGSSGIMLSEEQKAALQTSLILVQHDENFSEILFWGKIFGLERDYFIVQGTYENGQTPQKQADGWLPTRRTLYSRDCVTWGMLTPVTDDIMEKATFVRGRFSGDPSYAYELPIRRNEELTEEEEELQSTSAIETDNSPLTLKEEDRLSAVVAGIDHDTVIVPRGAYVRDSSGRIYRNRSFEGLSLPEATKLQYYFLFRKAIGLPHQTLLQRANLDSAIDFMDNIEEDVPQGRWSLQMERGGGVVVLRNLDWLGYTFYHQPGTKEYGSAYFGTGERNIDMPFML